MERLLDVHDEELAAKVARSTFITRLFVVIGVLASACTIVISLTIAIDTNQIARGVERQQDSNTGVLAVVNELAEDIDSCVDPKGACARRGQESQGKAIEQLNQYAIFLEACADAPGQQTEIELRACADLKVDAAKKREKP